MNFYLILSLLISTVASAQVVYYPELILSSYTVNVGTDLSFWTPIAVFSQYLRVQIGAQLFVSSILNSNGLNVRFAESNTGGTTLTNDGTILFSAKRSTTSPIFNLVLGSLQNTGTLILQNESPTFKPAMTINARSFVNSGVIIFHEVTGPSSSVNLRTNGNTIQNTGDLCFHNRNYFQSTPISGSGCIHLQGRTTLYFNEGGYSLGSQIIYMESMSAIIAIPSNTSPKGFICTIAGFGVGNGIRVGVPISDLVYNPTNGELSFTLNYSGALDTVLFNIGLGYSNELFEISQISSTSSVIIYTASAPFPGLPALCQACPPIPSAEIDSSVPRFTTYTTTVTITDNQQTMTSTGVVKMGTTDNGLPFSTTSFNVAVTSSEVSSIVSSSAESSVASSSESNSLSVVSSSVEVSTTESSSSESLPAVTSSAGSSIVSSSVLSSTESLSTESFSEAPSSSFRSSTESSSNLSSQDSSTEYSVTSDTVSNQHSSSISSLIQSVSSGLTSSSSESFSLANSSIDTISATITSISLRSASSSVSSGEDSSNSGLRTSSSSDSSIISDSGFGSSETFSTWSSGGYIWSSDISTTKTNTNHEISTTFANPTSSNGTGETKVNIETETKWLTSYTTICVTTNNGAESSVTGIVKIGTGTNGVRYTTTSIINPKTDSMTIKATSIIIQNPNNSKTTNAGVDENTEANGMPYTKTLTPMSLYSTTIINQETTPNVTTDVTNEGTIISATPNENPAKYSITQVGNIQTINNSAETKPPINSINSVENFTNGGVTNYINSILSVIVLFLYYL